MADLAVPIASQFLQCDDCCLLHHERTPLHVIEEWNGQFWVSCTLAQIGLVYQLGHGGFPCPFPDSTVRKLVVMEAPIIHEIRVSYCKCAKSDDADNLQQLLRNACLTRLYNVLGSMNVRDYITSLERMTHPSATLGMTWLPKLHVTERMPNLPQELHLPLDKIKVQYALPVWHVGSHNEDCQDENSLSLKVGVGKTDGEGVERTWSVLNPAAFSMKDSGRGVRADSLEGKIDNHNYLKNVGQGDALRRKLLIAIAERDKQITAFQLVNSTVEKEVKIEWRRLIKSWHADPSQPNPYTLLRRDCPTETQAPLHGRSATAFLVAGIQIENAQRRIIAELKGTTLMATDCKNRIQEWCHALLVKIGKFRGLQKIYMPGAALALDELKGKQDTEAPVPAAEKVKLFMSNEMTPQSTNDTLHGCVPGLVEMETKLRVAQCNNSLSSLRARLHAKRHLIHFCNSNVTGQIQSTKARCDKDRDNPVMEDPSRTSKLVPSLVQMVRRGHEVGERVQSYANRYRQGHKALEALKGSEAYPHLRPLRPDDVQLDGDAGESDAAAQKKLAMISAGRGARTPRNAPGTSKRVMSWIWMVRGPLDEAALHDLIRVEWSRALARKTRWCEEVMLLREEMRRVLRYLAWQAQWWRDRVDLRDDVTSELAAGLRGYTSKQAA
ncbi:hypothetical protein B0H14DRAFT_3426194 [Mycena olivaceomarginata]|nr:hypothetical protein B0H14DRAFT_3426194 [Mycena olivaceomarginata]